MSLKSVFSVSQPRSGHHVIEMMLRAALGQRFRYCEFYTEPGCCGSIACTRRAEFAAEGYQLFMQKTHDMQLADPVPEDVDLTLVQIREPTMRSLSNYELDLRSHHGLTHSPQYLQYYLATEAVYDVRFHAKWMHTVRRNTVLLRYEDLLHDPRASLADLFRTVQLDVSDADIMEGARQIRVSSADRAVFTPRRFETSKYFEPTMFREFMTLVWQETRYLNYTPWIEPADSTGTVGAIYRGLRALADRDFAGARAAVEPILDQQPLWPAVRQLYARALWNSGERAAGRKQHEELVRSEPDFFEGYIGLANIERQQSRPDAARALIRAGVERTGNIKRARRFLTRDWPDPELLAWLPAAAEMVARDDVLLAFRWVLGREAESEQTIEAHLRCTGWQDLRKTLMRSDEFKGFLTQHRDRPFGEWPGADAEGTVSEDDVRQGFRWILGRDPEDAAIAPHLRVRSTNELRYALLTSQEFREKAVR